MFLALQEFRAQQDKREKARIQMRKYRAKKRMELDNKGDMKPIAETDSEKRKLNAERMRRWREKKRIQATRKQFEIRWCFIIYSCWRVV